jgi:maltooligosyltrehalose trehalohydrolase
MITPSLSSDHAAVQDAVPTRLGAHPDSTGRTRFLVWAPLAKSMDVHVIDTQNRLVAMTAATAGYWEAVLEDCPPGTRYFYRIDGSTDLPDPASRFQPQCVHGPAEICEPAAVRTPKWTGIPLEEYIIYELHVGTFTSEGTLDAVIPHLTRLKGLGITALQLMPIAEFPGSRNWGYDGVYPFAVEQSYGGVAALHRLVRACHHIGLAVVLDVVYNHLGPEGNYLREFGPYFTDRYRTPWGDALNFDGPDSDHVRRLFIENALYWIDECEIDALRLDAVHAIYDKSAYPFLQELADSVHDRAAELGRNVYLIAECDLNDSRVVRSTRNGGLGLDAQWSDDFHHCVHTLLTGETSGYYADFGGVSQLATAFQQGWVYNGQYSPFRRVRFGNSPAGIAGHQIVVCSQNHDQIGNRMKGERLIHLAGPGAARLAAATVLLSPYIPLLFMGEEYGETAPFLYFVSHSDPELQEAVRSGRKEEFAGFLDQGEPPDPQDESTFLVSKLNHGLLTDRAHAALYRWYSELIRLRNSLPALRSLSKDRTVVECQDESESLIIRRLSPGDQVVILLHFGDQDRELQVYLPGGDWSVILDSEDVEWGGAGGRPAHRPFRSTGGCLPVPVAARACVVLSGTTSTAAPDGNPTTTSIGSRSDPRKAK